MPELIEYVRAIPQARREAIGSVPVQGSVGEKVHQVMERQLG